ncbi:hypothetical protein ANANG_G00198460 [Anguilla anguilla]|uniref:Uncharacterized protein n=1 Tax=Anguilla anguilla TaxID=7936 RepID=A0A9D3M2F9_ANGAN|nr:hypothetical protein ANANG_G00198460 [Anguilla anguilla]
MQSALMSDNSGRSLTSSDTAPPPLPRDQGYKNPQDRAEDPKHRLSLSDTLRCATKTRENLKMSGAAVSVCLLSLLSACTACYISNCPIGGKRSLSDSPLRKCMVCGPGTGAGALAPVSAAGRGSAASWAPRRRRTARPRATCPPPARWGAEPVEARAGTVPRRASAATQKAASLTNPVQPVMMTMTRSANQRTAAWMATSLRDS